MAFFTRPHDSVVLRPLIKESVVVANKVKENSNYAEEERGTAGEWLVRRLKNHLARGWIATDSI